MMIKIILGIVMLEQLIEYIKKNKEKEFKDLYTSLPLNAQHKKNIYREAFEGENSAILDFLEKKISLTQVEKIKILDDALINNIILNFSSLKNIQDIELSSKISDLAMRGVLRNHDNKWLENFVEKYPVTSFLKYNKLVWYAFDYEKPDSAKFLLNLKPETTNIMYSCLCAFYLNKRDMIFDLLLDHQLDNRDTISKLRDMKSVYMDMTHQNMEANHFINELFIETFANFLNNTLVEKEKIKKKVKKI
jgi:hypothetical protein